MTILKKTFLMLTLTIVIGMTFSTAFAGELSAGLSAKIASTQVLHRTVEVDGLDIFYREAGPKNAPTVLLLHGFRLLLICFGT